MSGKQGGELHGKLHSECDSDGCGIDAVVDGVKPVELEGGEVIINRESSQDPEPKHTFDGKKMTNKEILSAINSEDGNGVKIGNGKNKFKDGGELPQRTYLGEDGGNVISGKSKFDEAAELFSQGVDNEIIRQKTGWFKNPYDKLWRYEISDEGLEILPYFTFVANHTESNKQEKKLWYVSLDKIIKHELLFTAYPNIRHIPVVFYWDKDSGDIAFVQTRKENPRILFFINIYGIKRKQFSTPNRSTRVGENDISLPMDILTHEIQHLVQIREGLGGGNSAIREYSKLVDEWKEHNTGEISDEQKADFRRKAQDIYLRSSGEIEARDVEARLDYSDERRLIETPYSSSTIDPDFVIVELEDKMNFKEGGEVTNDKQMDKPKNTYQKAYDYMVNGTAVSVGEEPMYVVGQRIFKNDLDWDDAEKDNKHHNVLADNFGDVFGEVIELSRTKNGRVDKYIDIKEFASLNDYEKELEYYREELKNEFTPPKNPHEIPYKTLLEKILAKEKNWDEDVAQSMNLSELEEVKNEIQRNPKLIEILKKEGIQDVYSRIQYLQRHPEKQTGSGSKYDINSPLKISDVRIISNTTEPNRRTIDFEWDGWFYRYRYIANGSASSIHIYKHPDQRSLSVLASGNPQVIYNTFNSDFTTNEGRYLEYSISKWDLKENEVQTQTKKMIYAPRTIDELTDSLEQAEKEGMSESVFNDIQSNYFNDYVAPNPMMLTDFLKAVKSLKKKFRFDLAWELSEVGRTKYNTELFLKSLKDLNINVFHTLPGYLDKTTPIKRVHFTPSPESEGLAKITDMFVGWDDLRPRMMGTYFDKEHNLITATDAHRLIAISATPAVKKSSICLMGKALKYYKEKVLANPNEISKNSDGCWELDYTYMDYTRVIPVEVENIFEADPKNIRHYSDVVADQIANNISRLILFGYAETDGTKQLIGVNGFFMVECMKAMEMLGYNEVDFLITSPNRAIVIVPKGNSRKIVSDDKIETDLVLLMPLMLGHQGEFLPVYDLTDGIIKTQDQFFEIKKEESVIETPIETEISIPEETIIVPEEPINTENDDLLATIVGLELLLSDAKGKEKKELKATIEGLRLLINDTPSKMKQGGEIKPVWDFNKNSNLSTNFNGNEYEIVADDMDENGLFKYDLLENGIKVKSGDVVELKKHVETQKLSDGGDIESAKQKFAEEDIQTLTENGYMAITDTKQGVLWGEYENGIYSFGDNSGNNLFTGNRDEAINFIKNNYTVEGELFKRGGEIPFIVSYKSSPESKVYSGFEKVKAKSEKEAIQKAKDKYTNEWYEGSEKGREYTKNWVWEVSKMENGGEINSDIEKEAENILRTGKIESDHRNEEKNTRTIVVEIKPYKEYAMIVKKDGRVISLRKAQNELALWLKRDDKTTREESVDAPQYPDKELWDAARSKAIDHVNYLVANAGGNVWGWKKTQDAIDTWTKRMYRDPEKYGIKTFRSKGNVWTEEQKDAVAQLDAEFAKHRDSLGISPTSKEASELWRDGGYKERMSKIFNKEKFELGGEVEYVAELK